MTDFHTIIIGERGPQGVSGSGSDVPGDDGDFVVNDDGEFGALTPPIPVNKGGTNATTAAAARTNLGLVIGTDVMTQRTITGTANVITVSNGSGVSGNPTIDVGNLVVRTDGSYSDPSFLTSVSGSKVSGHIAGNAANVTGTVAITNGGTGQTSANAALNALLPSQGSAPSSPLVTNGTNASWATQVTIAADPVVGISTGATDSIALDVTLVADATGEAIRVRKDGDEIFAVDASGNVTANGGAGTISGQLAATSLTGTVAVNKGGTGQTTYTNGQLLIGNTTGNTLTKATLTAGSNVTITNGNGSIEIAASGGSPSGSAGQVQYTDGSAFQGAAGLVVDATSNGSVTVRQIGGSAGTDEITVSHDGSNGRIDNKDGRLDIYGTYNNGVRLVRRDATGHYLNLVPSYGGGESLIDSYSELKLCSGGVAGASASTLPVTVFRRRLQLTNSDYIANNYAAFFECATKDGVVNVLRTTTAGGAIASPATTVAQLTSNTDNLATTGMFQRLSSDASRNLSGMVSGSDGEVRYLINSGSNDIVLKHDTTSTAANRFLCSTGADLTLAANKFALCLYDNTSSRWRVTLLP